MEQGVRFLLAALLMACAACGPVGPISSSERSSKYSVEDSAEPGPRRSAKTKSFLTAQPVRFEANQGQEDRVVQFLSRSRGYSLFLTPTGSVWNLESVASFRRRVIRMDLLGANPRPKMAGLDRQRGISNYLLGSDPQKWTRKVPNFSKVAYRSVYPGTDLIYHSLGGRMEFDFVVRPGFDPARIELGFKGHDEITLNEHGDLILSAGGGDLVHHRPVIYQQQKGKRRIVPGGYQIKPDGTVRFRVGAYDRSKPLIIDPVLTFSTYLGGSQGDAHQFAHGVAVDPAGNAYVTGRVGAWNFPVQGDAPEDPFQRQLHGRVAAFVTKFSPSGELIYSTYLGDSSAPAGGGDNFDTWAEDIAVDAGGNAVVTGHAKGPDFPTSPNAFQKTKTPDTYEELFVTKLNRSGSRLLYSSFLGPGSQGHGVATDASGKIFVSGFTNNAAFRTKNAFQSECAGNCSGDAIVAKFDPASESSEDSLLFSSFLGGEAFDAARGVGTDGAGNAYVAGSTDSQDRPETLQADEGFPTERAFREHRTGSSDAFVTRISPPSGPGENAIIEYSTYFGGEEQALGEEAWDVDVDSRGNAYLTGRTYALDLPVKGGPQSLVGGLQDGFVAKLDTTQTGESSLKYSTYVGGSGNDWSYALSVDPSGSVFVTGETNSENFPVKNALQPVRSGPATDAFVAKLDRSGAAWNYSTYLGGLPDARVGAERGLGIAFTPGGGAVAVGVTGSDTFPTTNNAYQRNKRGYLDAFISRIDPLLPVVTSIDPKEGPAKGGTPVVIRGSGFTSTIASIPVPAGLGDVIGVSFGEAPASNFTVDSADQITAVSPPGAPGTSVHVTVATSEGVSTRRIQDIFTYLTPTIANVPGPGPSPKIPVPSQEGSQPPLSSGSGGGSAVADASKGPVAGVGSQPGNGGAISGILNPPAVPPGASASAVGGTTVVPEPAQGLVGASLAQPVPGQQAAAPGMIAIEGPSREPQAAPTFNMVASDLEERLIWVVALFGITMMVAAQSRSLCRRQWHEPTGACRQVHDPRPAPAFAGARG